MVGYFFPKHFIFSSFALNLTFSISSLQCLQNRALSECGHFSSFLKYSFSCFRINTTYTVITFLPISVIFFLASRTVRQSNDLNHKSPYRHHLLHQITGPLMVCSLELSQGILNCSFPSLCLVSITLDGFSLFQ